MPEPSRIFSDASAIIGENVRSLRQESGMTQAVVAQALEVTFQQVQKYERGINRISAETLYRLKVLFNAPYERFFEGMERLQQGGG